MLPSTIRIAFYNSTLAILFLFWAQIASFWCFARNVFGEECQPHAHLLRLLRTKISRKAKVHGETKVLLFNHVSWADFIIDNHITDCKSTSISRMILILAIPFSSLLGWFSQTIYFINRTKRLNIEHVLDEINNKYGRYVLLYPEGTRNRTGAILPLKRGFLSTIYKRNLQTQIVFVSNKEKVLDEKSLRIGFDVECKVVESAPIVPSSFATFDNFYQHVSSEWLLFSGGN